MEITNIYEINFLYTLLLTLTIESITLYFILKSYCKIELKKRSILKLFLPTFATLPYVWFVMPYFLKDNYLLYVLISESAVLVIEAFIIYALFKLSFKCAILLSFIANFTSYIIGELIK